MVYFHKVSFNSNSWIVPCVTSGRGPIKTLVPVYWEWYQIKFTALMTTDNKSKFIFCSFPYFTLFVVSVFSTWRWWRQKIILRSEDEENWYTRYNDGESCGVQPPWLKVDAEESETSISPSQAGSRHGLTLALIACSYATRLSYANIFCSNFGSF